MTAAPPPASPGPTAREAGVVTPEAVPLELQYANLGSRSLGDATHPDVNLMPPILDAVRAHASEGEIVNTLVGVFGRWRESPVI